MANETLAPTYGNVDHYNLETIDNKGVIQNEALRREHTRAVRARILVDLGRLDDAQREIDDALASNPLDVTALASAWYLARARGDAAQASAYAGLYDTLQLSPLRRLERLAPLGSPVTSAAPTPPRGSEDERFVKRGRRWIGDEEAASEATPDRGEAVNGGGDDDSGPHAPERRSRRRR